MKSVIQSIVEQAMGWLDETKRRDGQERWLELVETLRTVTEGKVCVTPSQCQLSLIN